MTDQFKAFLIAIPCLFLFICISAFQIGKQQREQAATKAITEQAELKAYRELSPEQKLRKEIPGIKTLKRGPNYHDIDTLQLTITEKFPSSYHWFLMTIEDTTAAAYKNYPTIELLDIKINLSGHDTYGQAIELPGLLYEMDRQTFQKIQWDTFDLDNLPKIATRWTPLHHQLSN